MAIFFGSDLLQSNSRRGPNLRISFPVLSSKDWGLINYCNMGEVSVFLVQQKDSSHLGSISFRFIATFAGIFKRELSGLDLCLCFSKSMSLSVGTTKYGFIFLLISSCYINRSIPIEVDQTQHDSSSCWMTLPSEILDFCSIKEWLRRWRWNLSCALEILEGSLGFIGKFAKDLLHPTQRGRIQPWIHKELFPKTINLQGTSSLCPIRFQEPCSWGFQSS